MPAEETLHAALEFGLLGILEAEILAAPVVQEGIGVVVTELQGAAAGQHGKARGGQPKDCCTPQSRARHQ